MVDHGAAAFSVRPPFPCYIACTISVAWDATLLVCVLMTIDIPRWARAGHVRYPLGRVDVQQQTHHQ
jgi:hypothetical protein